LLNFSHLSSLLDFSELGCGLDFTHCLAFLDFSHFFAACWTFPNWAGAWILADCWTLPKVACTFPRVAWVFGDCCTLPRGAWIDCLPKDSCTIPSVSVELIKTKHRQEQLQLNLISFSFLISNKTSALYTPWIKAQKNLKLPKTAKDLFFIIILFNQNFDPY